MLVVSPEVLESAVPVASAGVVRSELLCLRSVRQKGWKPLGMLHRVEAIGDRLTGSLAHGAQEEKHREQESPDEMHRLYPVQTSDCSGRSNTSPQDTSVV